MFTVIIMIIIYLMYASSKYAHNETKKALVKAERDVLVYKVLAEAYSKELNITENEKLLHEIELNQQLNESGL